MEAFSAKMVLRAFIITDSLRKYVVVTRRLFKMAQTSTAGVFFRGMMVVLLAVAMFPVSAAATPKGTSIYFSSETSTLLVCDTAMNACLLPRSVQTAEKQL